MINKVNQQQINQNDYTVQNNNNTRTNKNDITSDHNSIFTNGGKDSVNSKVSGDLDAGKNLLSQSAGTKNLIGSCNSQIDTCNFSSANAYNQMNSTAEHAKDSAENTINAARTAIEQNVEIINTANQTFNETAAVVAANQGEMSGLINEQNEIADEIEELTQEYENAQTPEASGNRSIYNLNTAAEAEQEEKEKKTPNADINKQEQEAIKTQINASMSRMTNVQNEQNDLSAKNDEVVSNKDAAADTLTTAVNQNTSNYNLATNSASSKSEEIRQQEIAEEDQAVNDQRFADKMGAVSNTGSAINTTGGICVQVSEALSAAAAGTGGCTFGISAAALEAVAVPLGTFGVYAEGAGSAVSTTASGVQFAKTGDAKDGLAFATSAASFAASVGTAASQLKGVQAAAGGATAKEAMDGVDATIGAAQKELTEGAEAAIQKSAKAEANAARILEKQGVEKGASIITNDAGKKVLNMDAIKTAATSKVEKKFAGKVVDETIKNREIQREMNKMLNKVK